MKQVNLQMKGNTNICLFIEQVWMGCLLLCNFILSNHPRFENSTVLELGGGTGLASIVMATTARFVICTGEYPLSSLLHTCYFLRKQAA